MNDITNKVLEAMYCDGKGQLAELVSSLPESEKELLIAPLIPILQSDSPYDRMNAIYVLGLLGPLASPAVPALIQAPENARLANVAWEVTKTLPNIGASCVVPELIKALGQAPAEAANGWASKDQDARIMEHLAAFGPAAITAAPYLVPYLGCYIAEKALASIGSAAIPAVIEEVQRGEKRHPRVYSNAADVLAAVGVAASQPLSEAFDQAKTEEARLSILQIFRAKPTPSHRTSLPIELYSVLMEKCFASADRKESREAHAVFGAYGAAVIPLLSAGMSNSNPYIQANAAAAMLKYVPDDSTALEKLLTFFAHNHEQVRMVALRAVTDAGGNCEMLVPAVMKALTDPDSEVRRQAAECLKQLGQIARIISKLQQSCSVAEFVHTDVSDVSLPMPSDTFIKDTLKHQFSENVQFYSAHRMDQPKFLKRHILVEVKGSPFGQKNMWSEASGVYAYDGKQLRYLDPQNGKNIVSDILRDELLLMDQVDPSEFAWFLNGTLLGGFAYQAHRVVEPSRNGADIGLELVTKPSLKAVESGGWMIEFWSKCEWGACTQTYCSFQEHHYFISEQFDITYEEKLKLESTFNR